MELFPTNKRWVESFEQTIASECGLSLHHCGCSHGNGGKKPTNKDRDDCLRLPSHTFRSQAQAGLTYQACQARREGRAPTWASYFLTDPENEAQGGKRGTRKKKEKYSICVPYLKCGWQSLHLQDTPRASHYKTVQSCPTRTGKVKEETCSKINKETPWDQPLFGCHIWLS